MLKKLSPYKLVLREACKAFVAHEVKFHSVQSAAFVESESSWFPAFPPVFLFSSVSPVFIPRYARVTVEGYDVDGKKIQVRAREELAIAFQHEIDHLNGIIFIDHIDPKNPFKDKENMRAI